MTGPPSDSGTHSLRWTRDRLLRLGLTDEHLALCNVPSTARRTAADLEPANFAPEFSRLVQRLQRLLRDSRGLSVCVTGPRADTASRQHAALQLALGLSQLGRQVALVDVDFLRPGLGGIVADPQTEGIIDMLRFGRSCGSVLLRPVPDGPFLLPAGSFPAEEPMPFEPDALRSLLYRVAQRCELALYVTPLPIRNEMNPLARLCDHVIYAVHDEEVETSRELLEHVGALQKLNAHLLGVVLYGQEGSIEATEESAPPAAQSVASGSVPEFDPGFLYGSASTPEVELPSEHGAGTGTAPSWSEPTRDTKPSRVEPIAEPKPIWNEPLSSPAADFPPLPEPDLPRWPESLPPDLEPAAAAPAPTPSWQRSTPPDLQLPRFEREPSPEYEESGSAAGEPRSRDAGARGATRSREEMRRAGEDLELIDAEFAYDEEPRYSRGPLYLLIALVVLIVGFLGWMLVLPQLRGRLNPEVAVPAPTQAPAPSAPQTAPSGTARLGTPAAPPPSPSASAAPVRPSGAEAPSGSAPDDRAAAGRVPGGTALPPAARPESPPPPVTTTPSKPKVSAPTEPAPRPAPRKEPAPPVVTPAPSSGATGAKAPAAAGENVYSVWVGSYKTIERASVDIMSLQKPGFEARAVKKDLGSKGIWYRVYVGSYPTAADAARARDAILKLPEHNFAQVLRLPRE